MFLNKPTAKMYSITPAFKGVLTKGGEPLRNQKLIRKLRWNGNEEGIEQVLYTNDEGEFELMPHEEELTLGVLTEFVGKTNLYIESSEGVLIWFSSKMTPSLNSEFKDTPVNIVCDAENPKQSVPLEHGLCLTRCTWDNMPQEEDFDEL